MTLPRWAALMKYWRRHPRTEWLAAGYLGFKPPRDSAADPAAGNKDELRKFLASFGHTGRGTVTR